MRTQSLVIAGVAALASPLSAQVAEPQKAAPAEVAKAPFDQADAAKAVGDLAVALEENYVFPDKGKAYATMLRAALAAGKYASFADASAFAETVTADLQAVHQDKHVRLRPTHGMQRMRRRAPGGAEPGASTVAKAGWLADGVAYIDLRGLPGNDATLADVRKFLAAHGDAKSLIIDVRHNGGGGLAEMNLIFAQIFAQPTTLVTMDIRRAIEEKQGAIFGDDSSLRLVKAPQTIVRREHFVTPAAAQGGLRNAKVYLLTSNRTFSAAEHLSLSLKRTHRATLIGEATGGGAHFGGMAPMGSGYAAFIPSGRTFDPDTGQSWEGTGVAPDVAVPADTALDEALRRAGVTKTAAVALAAIR